MEAVTVTSNPAINLLVDDTDDTTNPVLEVQTSEDNEGKIFQQIVLYSDFKWDQAEEVHKLIVFHSPRDPYQQIDWLEDLDNEAFASAEHNPYERGSERPVFGPEPPPKYSVPKERCPWDEDDLDFEERLAREFEEQEKRSEQQK